MRQAMTREDKRHNEHIHALGAGGFDMTGNLQAAHPLCNAKKGIRKLRHEWFTPPNGGRRRKVAVLYDDQIEEWWDGKTTLLIKRRSK